MAENKKKGSADKIQLIGFCGLPQPCPQITE